MERQITITREDAYEKGAAEKYPFWFYIRDNVWREEKWPPYGEAEYLNDRALRRLQLGQNSSETGEVVENAAELLKIHMWKHTGQGKISWRTKERGLLWW